MPAAVPNLSSASLSAQGYVRPNNEDRVHADDARGIYLVVDGVGGHAAGEQAAAIAVERICARLERPTDTPDQRLREAIALANNAIFEAARSRPEWEGMACVLTAAILADGEFVIGHVGDSRLYKIRHGAIAKITRDHSPVGEREDAGELTESEAMQHPRRNEVFRDVGTEEHAPDDPDFIDIFHVAFESDSALLLCSDGLSDVLRSDQILRLIEENARDPLAVVRSLIAAATRVGHDNVSAVFVAGEEFALSGHGSLASTRDDVREAERTDRLHGGSGNGLSSRRYASRLAWLACGVALGALIAFAVLQFVLPHFRPRPPRSIPVSVPATIREALASAHPGDTIVLAPGVYTEVVHLKDGVRLTAQRRREAVVEGSIVAQDITNASVEGIAVHAAEFGIELKNSAATLSDDEISGARDAGVRLLGASHATIAGCEIHNNSGPGVAVLDDSEASIRNNVIRSNGVAAGKLQPGLLVRTTAKLIVSGNIFAENGAEAIWLPAGDPLYLQANAFSLGAAKSEHPAIRVSASKEKSLESR